MRHLVSATGASEIDSDVRRAVKRCAEFRWPGGSEGAAVSVYVAEIDLIDDLV